MIQVLNNKESEQPEIHISNIKVLKDELYGFEVIENKGKCYKWILKDKCLIEVIDKNEITDLFM